MRIEESSRFLYVVQFTFENAIKASIGTIEMIPLDRLVGAGFTRSFLSDGGCRGLALRITVFFFFLIQRVHTRYMHNEQIASLKNVNLT